MSLPLDEPLNITERYLHSIATRLDRLIELMEQAQGVGEVKKPSPRKRSPKRSELDESDRINESGTQPNT